MVTLDADFYKTFGVIVAAIEPYLDDVVFVGGVANALYEYHPSASQSGNPVLMTKDIDLAIAQTTETSNSKVKLRSLLDEAGFIVDEEIMMAHQLTKFRLKDGNGKIDSNYEIEFLCPLKGRQPGPSHIEVQSGISATPLVFMDLPLWKPWELRVNVLPGLEDRTEVIRIPNPGVYLVQKFITMFRRLRPSERQKDAFYIYEFCLKFRDSLKQVSEFIDSVVAEHKYKKVKSFRRDFSNHFSAPDCDGIREIMVELEGLPFDEKQPKPDAAAVYAVIRRLVDAWEE